MFSSMSRFLKWWIVVASWEQGLRVRLGKRTELLQPGIHLRIPFVDRIYIQSSRIRVVVVNNQSLSTKDGKVITLSLAIKYRVGNIVDLYEFTSMPQATLLFEAMRSTSSYISTNNIGCISQHSLDEAVNADMAEQNFPGMRDVVVAVTGFCVSRCYRFMTGDTWLPTGKDLDEDDNSGEAK